MSEHTLNEQFFDAMVRHQIGLLRVSGRVRNEIFKLLDATEADMADAIKRRLRGVRGIRGPATIKRLNTLVRVIRAIRGEAWKKSAKLWKKELLEIAKAEPEFISGMLKTIAPVQLDLILPSTQTLQTLVTTRPFEGKVLADWAKNIERADLDRIEQAIRIGVTQGDHPNAIARRVVGTVQQRGTDGVVEITRRQAAGLTRTAVNGVANMAKREFYMQNSDLFDEELYVATLDSRTTPVCRSLDGERFPVGGGPIPPMHFNCRSLRVALIGDEAIGKRPAKPYTQRQLLDEYNRANGTKARTRGSLPRGHKGQFDDFVRTRVRQLTGQVDAKVTYQDWLMRQPATFQDDILGPTRAKLFRRGGLTLQKFVNKEGDELTLKELARRERDAFTAAGLDPEDFI